MISFLKKYRNKFRYAFAGLYHGLRYDRSISLQAMIGLLVVAVCLLIPLAAYEWVILLAMILFVWTAEFINSCLEQIVDIICPQYDERAKHIKDYAAAAVLLISILAALVGLYIIGGHIW